MHELNAINVEAGIANYKWFALAQLESHPYHMVDYPAICTVKNRVQTVFADVPQTYELLNHTLTLGQDILWRKNAAKTVASEGGTLWLDICSGTGESAAYLSHKAKEDAHIVAADFSLPNVKQGHGKAGIKANCLYAC